MTTAELEQSTREDLYLEVQRARLQETEGRVRKRAALAALKRRFPTAVRGANGSSGNPGKHHKGK